MDLKELKKELFGTEKDVQRRAADIINITDMGLKLLENDLKQIRALKLAIKEIGVK